MVSATPGHIARHGAISMYWRPATPPISSDTRTLSVVAGASCHAQQVARGRLPLHAVADIDTMSERI